MSTAPQADSDPPLSPPVHDTSISKRQTQRNAADAVPAIRSLSDLAAICNVGSTKSSASGSSSSNRSRSNNGSTQRSGVSGRQGETGGVCDGNALTWLFLAGLALFTAVSLFHSYSIQFGDNLDRGRVSRTKAITLELSVELEDLYTGKEITVPYRRIQICPHCHGTGAETTNDLVKCSACQGKGHVERKQGMGSLGFFAFQERCEKCRGTGVLIKHTCHQCGGSGTITVGDSVVVSIPPGAASDSIFVFPEKSNEMLGGVIPGDVRVNLRVKPHPDFVRINDTLKTSTTVSLLEALVGFVQEIKHLDGHIVYLNSSISTFPNTLTLKGEGMPCGKPPSPVVKLLCWYMSRPLPTCSGDLLVNINVRYPRSLSKRQTAGLRQLLADEDTNAGTEAAPH